MPALRGVQYELLTLLAEHPPFQIWRGKNPSTGSACLLKLFQQDDTGESQATADLVIAAVGRHHLVRNGRIVTARRLSSHNGQLVVEYPYLDLARWRPLTPDFTVARLEQVLSRLALLVDYLHLRGMVHGDLKLENVLVEDLGEHLDLRLIDLDFLQYDNARPHGYLFGTPGHIAPEVVANDRIVAQSDLFSLGVSLRSLLADRYRPLYKSPNQQEHLEQLIDELTAPDYLIRPRFLSDALTRHGLVTSEESVRMQTLLFAMVAAGSLGARMRSTLRSGQIDRWLTTELRLFGIPAELQDLSRRAAMSSLKKVVHAWRRSLTGAKVVRQAEFFHVSLTDAQLDEIMAELEEIEGDSKLKQTAKSAEESLVLASENRQRQRPLRALRLLRPLIEEGRSNGYSANQRLAILCEAIEAAASANRQSEVLELSIEAFHCDPTSSRLQHLQAAQVAAFRLGMKERVDEILAMAQADAGFAEEAASLPFRRVAAWRAQLEGRLDEAEEIFASLATRSRDLHLHETEVTSTYMLGVIAWRRNELSSAVEHQQLALQLADKYSLPQRSVSPLIQLSQMYFETGNYVRSISCAKAARKAALVTRQPALLESADFSLFSSYVRLARFDKASYWLQQWLVDRQSAPGSNLAMAYYGWLSFLQLSEGKVNEARLSVSRLFAMADAKHPQRWETRACLMAGQMAIWRGESEVARHFLQRGVELAIRFGDHAAQLECELFLAMAEAGEQSDRTDEVTELAASLIARRSTYRAAEAVFALLVRGVPLRRDLVRFAQSLGEVRGHRRCPLLAAVTVLVGDDKPRANWQPPGQHQWILAYQYLSAGHQFYCALEAACKIAETYAREGGVKRARNYFVQARRHAETLENSGAVQSIDRRLEELARIIGSEHSWIDSLSVIAQLMNDLHSYPQLLDRLLRFAVDQTGAERGIIFFRRADRNGLRPMATYNCDDQSVRELGDFSSTIPLNSISQAIPLFIDDAMKDTRTNKYQSVVAHNILSVACIPLVLEGSAVGVLYLDHHALPALFGDDDRKFMAAIGTMIVGCIARATELRALVEQVGRLRKEMKSRGHSDELTTRDPRLLQLKSSIPRIAHSSLTVLIQGESGTGKEVICDMIRRESPSSIRDIRKVNCAALPRDLAEAELFGIEANAATGVKGRIGMFEAADGGILFLDEIGDLPLDLQPKLFRAIEYQQFQRVGSNRTIEVDVRIVCATSRNLEEMVEQGKFRQELYYRIAKVIIEIPPLRQRRNDIPMLIEHFVELFSANRIPPHFTSEAYEVLISHSWPGNVRQLRAVMEYCCEFRAGEQVGPAQLPEALLRTTERRTAYSPPSTSGESKKAAEIAEKERMAEALRVCDGVQVRAAKMLNMPLSTFRRKMKKYGLDRK